MKRIHIGALLATLALVTAACTTSIDSATPSNPTTSEVAADASSLLAIGGVDGAISIVDDTGTVIEGIEPPSGATYDRPIWASSDTVVYTQTANGDNRLEATRVGGETVWSTELETPPFFYLASPTSASTTVVSLRNNAGAPGLVTERISGSDSVELLGNESPFYAAWHPGDGRLATHIADDRLDVIDTDTTTIADSASGFQAPVWLDDGLVTLRSNGGKAVLSVWNDTTFTDLAEVRGPARFVGSGDHIAIITGGSVQNGGIQASAQALPTITSGVLTVVDLADGSFTSVTSEPSPIFQWDPSGTRLLYTTFIEDPEPALVWHVWDDGTTTDYEPFQPDPSWFATVAPFFDQYAQSISLWAPDGEAFAFPAIVDEAPRILVQRLDEGPAEDFAAGAWVTWSPSR